MKKKSGIRKNKFYRKYFSVFFVLIVFGLVLYGGFNVYAGIKKHTTIKSVVYYPTLYSDKHITENAKISNGRFEEIYPFERESLLSNVISATNPSVTTKTDNEEENGVWLWTPPSRITPEYRNQVIAEAKKNGIKNIYFSIDTYLDIFVMPNGKEKKEKQIWFDGVLKDFISEANKNGITVDAEAGWRNWAEPGNTYKAFAILDYVLGFNEKYENKFRGVQYDIEPYLLPEFEKNSGEILLNFISLADRIVSKTAKNNINLSFVIPEFYDGTFDKAPRFFYGWKYGYAIDHLLKILDKKPGSKIVLMSYRNFSLGKDSSVEISWDEISKAGKSKTKIIIAQEVGDVEPSYVTFYNKPKKYFEEQVSIIEKTFKNEKSFGGIATHYINALMEMN